MTRLMLTIFCVVLCLCARADYRILFLNTPTIVIGGKALKVNDTFEAGATIKWSVARQAMKVLDTQTGERRVFVADDFSKAKASSLQAYLSKTKSLSTDGPGMSPFSSLASYLNNDFYLLDALDIETGVPTDSRHYFFITYKDKGHELTKAVPNNNGIITLTPGVFYFNGSMPSDHIRVKVYYYDKNADKVTTVCDKMNIIVLPRKIDTIP